MRRALNRLLCFVVCLVACALPSSANPTRDMSLVVAHHKRVTFDRDVSRIAVGDGGLLEVQLIDSRQVLALGRAPGATSLIVWFADRSHRTYRVEVERDLTLLRDTLSEIHPSITAVAAPDRDAIVLRGLVPDASFSFAAESAAQAYLAAGGRGRRRAATPVLQGEDGLALGATSDPAGDAAGETVETTGAESFRADAEAPTGGSVINLIRVENLPALTEERIKAAIDPIGGEHVTVHRYLKGDVPDDRQDVLVLEGTVPDQTALVRILSLAARLFLGESVDEDDIRVIANEAGGLQGTADDTAGDFGQQGGFGRLGAVFGQGTRRLRNRVESNVGRAKALDVANGRILSFIEVQDLPQVRVNVKFYEVNRDRTLEFLPSLAVAYNDSGTPTLPGADNPVAASGDDAASALLTSVLGGLTTGAQVVSGNFAVGAAFSLLETNNLARVLSAPSLKVLSGERARFLVGGEIPVRNSFSPAFGAPATGVFQSVQFVPFGIQLDVRPLVSEDDYITLDLSPQVSLPDPELNQALTSTGEDEGDATQPVAQLPTTSFEVRSLRTTSRLDDGDAMIMAGLANFRVDVSSTSTPGLRSIPGLGYLFEGFAENGDTIELIVVVNPVIEREPSDEGELWAFPSPGELAPWAPLIEDGDGDGVPYSRDACPVTPPGTEVDSRGCPLDEDDDGVDDLADQCPGTPAGAQVDEDGCPIDGDGDGVPDGIDRCPRTLVGVEVDFAGCALDEDGDGVNDLADRCPGTPPGARVDDDGCPFDEDGDGVPDGIDLCPRTLAGARVDDAGCALDTDGDGVPDGIDRCPDTPSGEEVGADGCTRAAPLVFTPQQRTLVLEGVRFETERAVLTADSMDVLDRVADSLVDWPEVRVEVGGHSDSSGDASYNLDLSRRRAESVRDYLVHRGVDTDRLLVRGYGQTQPIADNATPAGRRRNRRVELKRLE